MCGVAGLCYHSSAMAAGLGLRRESGDGQQEVTFTLGTQKDRSVRTEHSQSLKEEGTENGSVILYRERVQF